MDFIKMKMENWLKVGCFQKSTAAATQRKFTHRQYAGTSGLRHLYLRLYWKSQRGNDRTPQPPQLHHCDEQGIACRGV